MSTAAPASRVGAGPSGSSRWLFGPWPDLLLGCGVAYLAVFALLGAFGAEVRTALPGGLFPLLSVLIGAPHYGATLLRVYARREDRRAYSLFAVWVTVLLAAAFVVATRSPWLGSLLLTLYLTWSPWHYTGQNYGLALLFLRRRGAPVDATTKRLLYAAFLLSFVMTFAAMHRGGGSTAYAPTIYEGYRMLALGLGRAADWVIPLTGLLAAFALAGAALRLLRGAGPRDLLPAALLVLTQALWFPIPVLARHYGVGAGIEPLAAEHATYYFFYAAIGHSLQYVWVTSYYAARAPGFRGYGPYLAHALWAGAALWVLPALVFAPDVLGRLPFELGLGALVAAVVNLHHFVLDGAIWKLRDGRIARVLIRSEPEAPALPEPIRPRRWAGPMLGAAGVVSVCVLLLATFEHEVGFRRALERGDFARGRRALVRLEQIGRASPALHFQLGRALASRGDRRGALHHYQRSLELHPTPEVWVAMAEELEAAGQLALADEALRQALDLSPQQAAIAYRSGRIALKRGDRARARSLFERALAIEPGRKLYQEALARATARDEDAGASHTSR
jgi:hypothetical protein